MKAKKIVSVTFALVMISIIAFAIFATHAIAQDAKEGADKSTPFPWKDIAIDIVMVAIFSIVGLIILMIGYKVFDLATPYDLNRQIAEENNVAAGIAVAGVILALGIIIHAAMG